MGQTDRQDIQTLAIIYILPSRSRSSNLFRSVRLLDKMSVGTSHLYATFPAKLAIFISSPQYVMLNKNRETPNYAVLFQPPVAFLLLISNILLRSFQTPQYTCNRQNLTPTGSETQNYSKYFF
jgi:hypothetical protein